MLNTIEGIDTFGIPSVRKLALMHTVQQLQNTLDNLKKNHPTITDEDISMIKKYISDSLKAQEKLDDTECEKEKKELTGNPLIVSNAEPSSFKINTVKTGGINRKMMEFVTSERHAIGIYKRCVYEIERMDEAVDKLKKMTAQSKLNHMKQQLLNSYTKHYYRFKNDYGMLLRFNDLHGKLEKEFESSHDVRGKSEWRQDLEHWETPGYPRTPATYQREYNIHP